ncbi:MAG TPA: ABC transporter substrate-binding protein [Anaeromyxobacter sp.]|nr:ABC transporter substrate-binding protein [Anaeromyxobacter sp.]
MRPRIALALLSLLACRGQDRAHAPLRLGYFPNLTHAQALVGVADGTFARALEVPLEPRRFNAGPAAMEALLSDDLDAAYVGPGPAAIAYLRSRGQALRVVAGAVSGGAVLVVRPEVHSARDLVGRRVASPQLGNTQDVALRTWLRAQGLGAEGGPGAATVTPMANPDMAALLSRGDLAGAFVPEPWGALLRERVGGRILLDERTLWPGGRFPTTLLVVSTRALKERRSQVVALLRAHLALTERWARDPAAFARAANAQYESLTDKPLPEPILSEAFARLEPVTDPMRAQTEEMARRAHALGYAPDGDLSGIVDGSLLEELARQ